MADKERDEPQRGQPRGPLQQDAQQAAPANGGFRIAARAGRGVSW